MTTQDEATIRKLIAATTGMFDRYDAQKVSQLSAPDADLVIARGEVMKGSAETEGGLNGIHATRAGGET